jgi:hypothetical protein|tara:strand:- start:34 stop:309 length:276 start_codon:yes stop_codon:yes gene_type:complete
MLPIDLWQWEDEWTELYIERSAIMEHDGCLPRRAADFKAQMCIRRLEERDNEGMQELPARPEPERKALPARWAKWLQKDGEDRQGIPELIK